MHDKTSNMKSGYVLYRLYMPCSNATVSVEFCSSYGTNLLDHLTADGACLTGGQVAVVAIGQVNANFLGR